jgi:hypothetical protein
MTDPVANSSKSDNESDPDEIDPDEIELQELLPMKYCEQCFLVQ